MDTGFWARVGGRDAKVLGGSSTGRGALEWTPGRERVAQAEVPEEVALVGKYRGGFLVD